MSDLIDRDALLQDMTHRGGFGIGDWHIFDVINEQPSIDAQPVKRGHWVLTRDEEYEYCHCSECGYDTGENWMIGSEIPYCSQCGSKNYDRDANIDDSITISECIERLDAIKAALGDKYEGFLAGNVLKYVYRYPDKNGVEDCKKARFYLDKLIEVLSDEKT